MPVDRTPLVSVDGDTSTAPAPRSRTEVTDGWQLHLIAPGDGAPSGLSPGAHQPGCSSDSPLPAVVPGVVHTDLVRAGVLDDPTVGLRERDQHWVGRSTWAYRSTVMWEPNGSEHVDLDCEGLDTVAELRLNGEVIGTTRNMHRRHRFDVTDRLREGVNDLVVVFHPVHDEIDRVRDEVGILPATDAVHYPYVRKMACNFGWDWGPVLVTAGIWRPIALESWSHARLDALRPLATFDGVDDAGHLDLHIDVCTDTTADLRARVSVAGTTVEGVEQRDRAGTGWGIRVNGRRIAIRGFNWIPDTPFPSEIDRARYGCRIGQAVEANANLLRVWGGGIYESADFYEQCDEAGVLVWQDFLFACAAYPETDEFRAEVEAEARQAVADRAHHPSLILWNGNNECTWGWHDWGWQEVLGDRPWGRTYYDETLPAIVADLDPTRPYLPGSPSAGDLDVHPNDDARGVSHLWNVWNDEDYVHYRDREPAFVAEFGFCGPATWATMRRGVPDGDLTLDNEVVLHHLRAEDGVTKLERGLAEHFPAPRSADDWLWAAQLNQARALTVGVDHLRALERCSGAVVWQLNDCWPVISWAAVDSDERRKPLWYALRAAFAPRRVVVVPDGDGLALAAVNDEPEAWDAGVVVRRVAFDGSVLAETRLDVTAPALGVGRVALPHRFTVPGDTRRELLVVDADGHGRTTWYWARDKDLDHPIAVWDSAVTPCDGGLRVRITARTLLRDLAVFPDRLLVEGAPLGAEAVASDLLLTLLPGESGEFTVHGAGWEHADAITAPPVLRAANDRGLVRR